MLTAGDFVATLYISRQSTAPFDSTLKMGLGLGTIFGGQQTTDVSLLGGVVGVVLSWSGKSGFQ
jgi:hypothetical protein